MIRAKLRCIQEVAALVTMEYYLLLRPFRSDQCQIWTQRLSARTKAFLSTHVTRQLPHHKFISSAVNTFFPPSVLDPHKSLEKMTSSRELYQTPSLQAQQQQTFHFHKLC